MTLELDLAGSAVFPAQRHASTGPHRPEKFDRQDFESVHFAAGRRADRAENLVQQDRAGNDRVARKMALGGGMIRGKNDFDGMRQGREPASVPRIRRPFWRWLLEAACRWNCAAGIRPDAAGAA